MLTMYYSRISQFVIILGITINLRVAYGKFICEDGTVIEKSMLCDGRNDCKDNSDETSKMCFYSICSRNKFRCHYGGCIDKKHRCDNTGHCNDKSDEKYCHYTTNCSNHEFQCFSGETCVNDSIVCDGRKDCDDGSDEIAGFCENRRCPKDTFRCRCGGCIYNDLLCDRHPDCADGSDELDLFCTYRKFQNTTVTCKPIGSNGIYAICISDIYGHISCNEVIPVNTVAKLECKEFYRPIGEENNIEIVCQPDGTWNGNVLKCQPDCGTRHPAAEPMILHGRNITKWPWHSIMYMLKNGNWVPACGGTLISERLVLTAAHCTWKKSLPHLKFAFSKYRANFSDNDEFTLIRDVESVIVPPEYLDFLTNYGSDIAVVVLSQPVQFSDNIKPACLDWNSSNIDRHFNSNEIGTIAGMGMTEEYIPSQTLQYINLRIIPTSECIKNQKSDFKKYITFTIFCGSYEMYGINGTNVCNGDSGGGLLFRDALDGNRWILQGLVSISPRRKGTTFCDPLQYAVFTRISVYSRWLRRIITEDST